MSAAPWPETWIEAARAMRLKGRSARQIADGLNAQFGAGLTRSAVIGKLCRMGVTAFGKAKPAKWPLAPRTPPAQETDAPPSATVGIDILALTRSVCCWPIDPAGARGWRYCGAPVDARELAERGKRYCAHHAWLELDAAGRKRRFGEAA
jgi:GcrA cell cycle regulator